MNGGKLTVFVEVNERMQALHFDPKEAQPTHLLGLTRLSHDIRLGELVNNALASVYEHGIEYDVNDGKLIFHSVDDSAKAKEILSSLEHGEFLVRLLIEGGDN